MAMKLEDLEEMCPDGSRSIAAPASGSISMFTVEQPGCPACWPKTSKVSWPVINTAYYLGFIPVRWDRQRHRYEMTESTLGLLRWRATVVAILALDTTILYGMYHNFERLEFDLHAEKAIIGYQAGSGAALLNSMIMHANTLLNMEEVQSFLNSWVLFYEKFQGEAYPRLRRSGTKIGSSNSMEQSTNAKYDGFCAKVIALFYVQFHWCCWLWVAAYVFVRCDLHALGPLLPICGGGAGGYQAVKGNNVYQAHKSLPMVPVWAGLQMLVGVGIVDGCMMYLHFLPIFISQGLVVARDMRRLLSTEFYCTYRCVRMLIAHFNRCISFVAPAHILYLVVVSSLTLCGVISGSSALSPLVVGGCCIFMLTMTLYIVYAGGSLSRTRRSSKTLLRDAKDNANVKRRTHARQSAYRNRVERSCPPLDVRLGWFGTMPEDFVTLWGLSVLDMTISMLLL